MSQSDDERAALCAQLNRLPEMAVWLDAMLERGAALEVWTDDEVELCRLQAFDLSSPFTSAVGGQGRNWGNSDGFLFAVERFFSPFDRDDWALEVWADPEWLAELEAGNGGLPEPECYECGQPLARYGGGGESGWTCVRCDEPPG